MKVYGPPGFDVQRYVEKLRDPRMSDPEWRRRMCKRSPLLFALVYLDHHIQLPDGQGGTLIALAEFHVELAMAAKRWARDDIGPKEVRDAWVAPREMGKSTWLFLILALWSLAFGHLRFIVVYSDIEKTAKDHLKNLKLELVQNELLRADFPELCSPLVVNGRSLMNDTFGYAAESGSAIAVRGMNSATLGVKLGQRRPDALWFDDIEPKEGNYSAGQKDKRLIDLVDAIFPCNVRAVVQIVGTTVMAGSIIHEIIQGKPWVAEQQIEVHHFRGLVEDADTGEERSCWPWKWSTEFLVAERAGSKRSYAKNFENEPVDADGTYWDEDDIVHDDTLRRWITEQVLVVDPAAKSKKSNDETGIAMLGHAHPLERTLVERCIGVRLKTGEVRELVHRLATNNGIKTIVVDVTNGGDHVLNTFEPLPAGVKIVAVNLRRSKADRFAAFHDRYQRGEVVHARPIPGLESQMKAYPRVLHDDRIDAVCLGDEYFRGELPGQRPGAA